VKPDVNQQENSMGDQENRFIIRERLPDDIQQCFIKVASLIRTKLPCVEIIHVGSTAVSGCLTKGDIDILVRVSTADFPDALAKLDEILVRSDRNISTHDYIEFDYVGDDLPVSVQLVSVGGVHDDFFYRVPLILNHDKEALQKFNNLKIAFNGCDMETYRRAKSKFFESLITEYDTEFHKAG
jgi:GrpB-like predicted nucleotidyltransferase (UPF0157 family)